MLYEMGEVSFHLMGANDFQVNVEKDFFLGRSRCRQNLKISIFHVAWDVLKCAQHVRHDCYFSTIVIFHSTNQIIDLWRCRF